MVFIFATDNGRIELNIVAFENSAPQKQTYLGSQVNDKSTFQLISCFAHQTCSLRVSAKLGADAFESSLKFVELE